MITKIEILRVAQKHGIVKTRDFSGPGKISRQYASALLAQLVAEGKLIKIGHTRGALYLTPEYNENLNKPFRYHKIFSNKNLEEHQVLVEIEKNFPLYHRLPENTKSIFTYAFLEMLNNAIEHSKSTRIEITIIINAQNIIFSIDDYGIGVFRNIKQKHGLHNELEAIQDLLKGKTTTEPALHSGEGIFFTSRVSDAFNLNSYGYQLLVDNIIKDTFVREIAGQKQGTRVTFQINKNTPKHLNNIFKKYTNQIIGGYGFDKTEIRVRLYTQAGIHISRSQARRILVGLDKFELIIMDYDRVPMVGQAFADEIYRVFKKKYPTIVIQNENMNEAVRFMVERAINEASKP